MATLPHDVYVCAILDNISILPQYLLLIYLSAELQLQCNKALGNTSCEKAPFKLLVDVEFGRLQSCPIKVRFFYWNESKAVF